MLSVEGLIAGYGGRDVLTVDRLAFAPGSVSVLLGPNGSGKSTLMRCLAGALRPRKGSVRVDNDDISRLPAREAARRLAYVPQEAQYAFAFTARELVGLGAEAGGRAGEDARRAAGDALARFEMEALADRSLAALSGGERQRAQIARAVAQGSPCLLLDEPTAHLDLRHQAVLRDVLREAARRDGKTVVLVLHDLNLAASFADTVVLLGGGRIAAEGSPEDALTPETLAQVYRTPVRVSRETQTGARWFTPDA